MTKTKCKKCTYSNGTLTMRCIDCRLEFNKRKPTEYLAIIDNVDNSIHYHDIHFTYEEMESWYRNQLENQDVRIAKIIIQEVDSTGEGKYCPTCHADLPPSHPLRK